MSLEQNLITEAAEVLRLSSGGDVLVVIPTLNEEAHISSCLDSLLADREFMADASIVVVDGGSTDSTCAIVESYMRGHDGIRLVQNPDRIQSAGINAAVASVAGPQHRYIVRCDAHSVYPSGYVRKVVEAMEERPEAASVATVLDAVGVNGFQRSLAFIADTPLGSGCSAHRGGTTSGWVDHAHHAGFRLDWFRQLGGYDARFSHNEDAEYDHRLGLAGGKVWLASDIRIDYAVRPSLGSLTRQFWRYGQGRARTVMKHRMKPRLRQMIPTINLLVLISCLILSCFMPVAILVPAAYVGMLSGVSIYVAVAMKELDGLWAGPAIFAMQNAWAGGFIYQLLRQMGHDA